MENVFAFTTSCTLTKLALEAVILGGFCLGMNQSGHLRRRWWAMSLISWLAFECLLRPSEAINLLVGDIVFPSLELAGSDPNLVVVIRNPKTRRIWRTQFAICSDIFLIDWLKWWCRDLDSKCRVFPISRAQWSSLLKACCGWLDVDNIGYTLSSFRSGGATHVFRTEQNLGRLQYRGRWKSAATLESYLQEAMSAHATHVVSDRGRERVAVVRQAVHRLTGGCCNPPLPRPLMARRELLEAASRLTAALERLALEDEEWESVSTVSVPHTTTATSEVAKGKVGVVVGWPSIQTPAITLCSLTPTVLQLKVVGTGLQHLHGEPWKNNFEEKDWQGAVPVSAV